MAETTGDADSASSGIHTVCEGHLNTEACSKCMYSKYRPQQVFRKKLSRSDIQRKGSYRLYLQKLHAARFRPQVVGHRSNGSHPVTVYDVQMKLWPMRLRTSGGKAHLTRGWSRFAEKKNLSEGDYITFYELNCMRGTGTRVFMIGVSRKQCIQILGAPIMILGAPIMN